MYNIERHEAIMRLLSEQKSISVDKLAEVLYVSQPTVRRDLTILQEEGKVVRTHGGVVLAKSSDAQVPLILRESQNNSSKKAIAVKAVKFIKNGNVIFLDASSTVSYIVPYLCEFKDIIVITNSPKTSMKLGELRIKNYCTGGLLLDKSVAYVGSEAENFIRNFNADILFFSGRGLSENGIITDSSAEESNIRKVMINHSKRKYFLCDGSKIGKTYMYNICASDIVDEVISEKTTASDF